jgi:DNA-binding HxlR family transcriptional regulator
MLDSRYEGQDCSIARALEAVGERWTLLIVRELLRGPQRFSDLEAALEVSKNVLAARLDKLVALKIVARSQYDAARDWNEYSLTRKGYDLFPVVNALMAWGDRYEAPNGPPVVIRHACGHPAGHLVVCEHCRETVNIKSVMEIPGPGAATHPPA